MKIMLKIWMILGSSIAISFAQNTYGGEYLNQDKYDDADNTFYHQSGSQQNNGYAPLPYKQVPNIDTKYQHQSLDSKYSKPEEDIYSRRSPYTGISRPVQHYQPERPSYHKPQDNAYHQEDTSDSQEDTYQAEEEPSYPRSAEEVFQPGDPSYPRSAQDVFQPGDLSYPKSSRDVYHSEDQPSSYPRSAKEVFQPGSLSYPRSSKDVYQPASQYQKLYQGSSPYENDGKRKGPKYGAEEPEDYTQSPIRSPSQHPRPVPTDPKLPLYFTMYEKRVIADPTDKYGKGPWRFLTYGHGITYGSKEPGKVFEKGYGYIRALGRDHCDLPKHLCPPRSDKPFDYDGRKEPYYGYRPH